MMRVSRDAPFVLSGTSPAAAGNSVLATQHGLARYNALQIDAVLLGATGDVIDLYLQRRVASGVWLDWLHFAQLAAGAGATYSSYAGDNAPNANVTTVGQMSDDLSVGAFALPAGVFVGGLPGDAIRLCAVAGAATSAGAVQKVTITGFELFT
jgi:hypothetical protein